MRKCFLVDILEPHNDKYGVTYSQSKPYLFGYFFHIIECIRIFQNVSPNMCSPTLKNLCVGFGVLYV